MRRDEALQRALEDASEVLFLCSGNMIRSAFAELYARHLGCALPVLSAATTYDNEAIYPKTRAALLARGVAPKLLAAFRPSLLREVEGELSARTIVFGMTDEHLTALRAVAVPAPERRFLLPLLDGDAGEIPDPMFEGGFEHAFTRIAALVERLVADVAQ